MKQEQIIVLGLAALAVYLIMQSKGDKLPKGSVTVGDLITETPKEIFDAFGKAFANGWRYFDNGTSIDPYGAYYQGGQLVWSPAK